MHPRSPKWLEDIHDAGTRVVEWTAGLAFDAYSRERIVQAAVERSFEIIGEAIVRIERVDPETAARVPDRRNIVGLRNQLAHGYDTTDQRLLWTFIHDKLPELLAVVEALLREAEADYVQPEAG